MVDVGAFGGYSITGYGLCNSLGHDSADIRRRLRGAERRFTPCPLDVPFDTVCGLVDDALPRLPNGFEAYDSRLARMSLLGMRGLAEPLTRAIRRWGANRVAMLMSTSTGGMYESEQAYSHYQTHDALPEGYRFSTMHAFCSFVDVLRGAYGVTGPRYVISTACSSGGKVFSSAQRLIQAGIVDAAVVGGADALCYTTVRGFHSLGVLAKEPCRPFGAARPGMNIGEGAAFVLVEREADSELRLLGTGETSDAFHMSAPDPQGRGARAAMVTALKQAGLRPEDVDYINAHGTGTRANDVTESKAIHSVFGNAVPVASTKGYTGHTLGACGVTEAIFALMSIEDGFVPQSVGAEPIDPEVQIRIATESIEAPVRVVMSNSFAFGGNNASVLFGRTA